MANVDNMYWNMWRMWHVSNILVPNKFKWNLSWCTASELRLILMMTALALYLLILPLKANAVLVGVFPTGNYDAILVGFFPTTKSELLLFPITAYAHMQYCKRQSQLKLHPFKKLWAISEQATLPKNFVSSKDFSNAHIVAKLTLCLLEDAVATVWPARRGR